jgi:hypothetical protein
MTIEEVLRAHIARLPDGDLVCPICKGNVWQAGETLDREQQPTLCGGRVRPWMYFGDKNTIVDILVVSCKTCHFVCPFLWEPLARAASAAG